MTFPALMRTSDVMVLPTIEEGFGLVCTEAMASGCVPVVSDACTDICTHMENALWHSVGDVQALYATPNSGLRGPRIAGATPGGRSPHCARDHLDRGGAGTTRRV